MCSGASIAQEFAASTNVSLMMLTVNSFVSRIFSRVSLGRRLLRSNDMLSMGGLCEIFAEEIPARYATVGSDSEAHQVEIARDNNE